MVVGWQGASIAADLPELRAVRRDAGRLADIWKASDVAHQGIGRGAEYPDRVMSRATARTKTLVADVYGAPTWCYRNPFGACRRADLAE